MVRARCEVARCDSGSRSRLHDVRGLPEAGVIAWIGPKEFYRKTVGAVEDRRFIQLERPAK